MRTKILDKNLEKFILSLNKLTQVKIVRTIELLEKFGYNLRYPSREIKTTLNKLKQLT